MAAGKPHLITPSHIPKNQIVIDVSITVIEKKKVVGDVDYKRVKNLVSATTPVPLSYVGIYLLKDKEETHE